MSVLRALYPESRFSHIYRADGRLLFYSIVADLLDDAHTVLDFGAGRGLQIEAADGHIRSLVDFRGRCSKVIGVDPDPAVLKNPYLDEAYVMTDGQVPLADDSVDIIVAYAVLEHIAEPKLAANEALRVLKPGGWFCAWTPNKWGYVEMAAGMVPNRWHTRIARATVPKAMRSHEDVFPTVYRLNTVNATRNYFPSAVWNNYSFTANGSPSYHFESTFVARFWQLVMALSPAPLQKTLFVFAQKKANHEDTRAEETP